MMKKMVALLLAALLVIGVCGTAMADQTFGTNDTNGVIGALQHPDTVTVTDKTVIFPKNLKVYNPTTVSVNAPTITYTYVIEQGSAGKNITDDSSVHAVGVAVTAPTKAGILSGLQVTGALNQTANTAATVSGNKITNTIAWTTAGTVNAGSTGVDNIANLELDFSNVDFSGTGNGAGVYRYKITETATTYGSSGVEPGDAQTDTASRTGYLDVYVKDSATAGEYDIYGYVFMTADADVTTATTTKKRGFDADNYYTFNVSIKKILSGDQIMNSHQFPFYVTFANSKVTANVLPIVEVNDTSKVTAPTTGLTAAAISTFTFGDETGWTADLKIANDGTVTIKGIPAGTTVTIDEKNDVAGTTYSVTATGGTTEQTTPLNVVPNTKASETTGWTTVTAMKQTENTNAAADENVNVIFTNSLALISPTGVVMRVAPYVLILAAGITLLLISRRRKAAEEE